MLPRVRPYSGANFEASSNKKLPTGLLALLLRRSDRTLRTGLLASLRTERSDLRYGSERLQDDKEIILMAVSSAGAET